MNIKDEANVCKTCASGDRLKAETVLFWLVHSSFQIHWFIDHFFDFSIIVQKNRTIQVASCEDALLTTNRKPILNHQSKNKCFFSKLIRWDLSLTDILSTWSAVRKCRVGFLCFLLVNSALSRFLCKNDCLVRSDCSYFSNCKHQKMDHIWTEYDHILQFTNHKSTLLGC